MRHQMKKIKLFLALLLCSALLGRFPAMAVNSEDPAFVVSSAKVSAGETVDITISIKNNPGIASAKLEVAFDDALTLNSVAFNGDMGGMSMQPEELASPVALNWLDFAGNFNGDAVFATLNFTVADDASAGDYSIEVSYEADNVYNIAEENVSFHVSNGSVAVGGEAAAEKPDEPLAPPTGEAPDAAPEDDVPADVVPDSEAVSGVPGNEAPGTSNMSAEQSDTSAVPQDAVVQTPVGDADSSQPEDNGSGMWLPVVLVICAALVCGFVFVRMRAKQKEQ